MTLEQEEAAARERETEQRRERTLSTLDQIMLLADTLPEDLTGTLSMLARYQIIGVALAAKSTIVGRRRGPLFPCPTESDTTTQENNA